MTFNSILIAIDQNTKIRLTVHVNGMKFSTEHFAEYYLASEVIDEFLDREVMDMRVIDGLLEVVLK